MAGAAAMQTAIQRRRILVVEDEYMIADEIAEMLSSAGACVLGPVGSVGDALRLVAAESWIDGALLDVNVGQQAIWPVVDTLLARSVPLVLTTGYDASAIPRAYAHLSRCEKPVSGRELADALASQLPTRAEDAHPA